MGKRLKKRTVANSLERWGLLPRCFRAISASLFILASAQIVCPNARAGGCEEAPILFAFQGTLFQARADGDRKPVEFAHGFERLRDLTLSPDCARYAFTQSDALWAGEIGRPPRKAEFPGRVLEYMWTSDGQAIVATVGRPGCTPPVEGHWSHPVGSVFLAGAPAFVPHQLTSDCATSLAGGGTRDDRILLNRQSPLPDCPDTEPICAISDFVVLNMRSGAETTLLTAQQLREKRLSDLEGVGWSPQKNIVYLWSVTILIGGDGALLAVQIPSGRILWHRECYEATQLEDDLLAIRGRETNKQTEKMDLVWAHKYVVVRDGKVVAKYPLIPSDLAPGLLSPGGRYIAWETEAPSSITRFATKTTANAWLSALPEGFEIWNRSWAPKDVLVGLAYREAPRGTLSLVLWSFDPGVRTARQIFQAEYHPGPDDCPESARLYPERCALRVASGVAMREEDGKWYIPPLVPAVWQHH